MSNKGTGDYEVGYGRPPKHTRFKKGHSGNPKGRPNKSLNMKTYLEDAFTAPVSVRTGDKVEKVPAAKAMVQAMVLKALKGDIKAFNGLVNLSAAVGLSLVNVESTKGLSATELSALAQIFDIQPEDMRQQLGLGGDSEGKANAAGEDVA